MRLLLVTKLFQECTLCIFLVRKADTIHVTWQLRVVFGYCGFVVWLARHTHYGKKKSKSCLTKMSFLLGSLFFILILPLIFTTFSRILPSAAECFSSIHLISISYAFESECIFVREIYLSRRIISWVKPCSCSLCMHAAGSKRLFIPAPLFPLCQIHMVCVYPISLLSVASSSFMLDGKWNGRTRILLFSFHSD